MSQSEAHLAPHAALTAESVIDYLVDRGVIDEAGGTVEVLSGGVSADAFAVHAPNWSWVVKQALARLKVAAEWHADPSRILNEAAALQVVGERVPDSVPSVASVDQDRLILVMQHAPPDLHDWKSELMAGGIEGSADTAARLGEILAALHAGTFGDPILASRFGDTESFVDLRIDPFHRAVARRLPDLAGPLGALAAELTEHPQCLVHGDYSPKNVLASGPTAWVIDWEVAHFGNPVFDLAFMLAHLMCKTAHAPRHRAVYRGCAQNFLTAYNRDVPGALKPDPFGLVRHTAAVVLARTDGKSPAAYLEPPQREAAQRAAIELLNARSIDSDVVQQLWSVLT